MSYKIITTDNFKKEVKKLNKKYPSLKNDLKSLSKELSVNPELGTSLGKGVFKIRLSISSKGKGKSGSARVISLVRKINNTIYLVSIYNTSKIDNLSDKEIQSLIKKIL